MLDREAKASLIAFAEEMEASVAALEPAAQTVSHNDAVAVQHLDPDVGQT
jgi:hypothetical protein